MAGAPEGVPVQPPTAHPEAIDPALFGCAHRDSLGGSSDSNVTYPSWRPVSSDRPTRYTPDGRWVSAVDIVRDIIDTHDVRKAATAFVGVQSMASRQNWRLYGIRVGGQWWPVIKAAEVCRFASFVACVVEQHDGPAMVARYRDSDSHRRLVEAIHGALSGTEPPSLGRNAAVNGSQVDVSKGTRPAEGCAESRGTDHRPDTHPTAHRAIPAGGDDDGDAVDSASHGDPLPSIDTRSADAPLEHCDTAPHCHGPSAETNVDRCIPAAHPDDTVGEPAEKRAKTSHHGSSDDDHDTDQDTDKDVATTRDGAGDGRLYERMLQQSEREHDHRVIVRVMRDATRHRPLWIWSRLRGVWKLVMGMRPCDDARRPWRVLSGREVESASAMPTLWIDCERVYGSVRQSLGLPTAVVGTDTTCEPPAHDRTDLVTIVDTWLWSACRRCVADGDAVLARHLSARMRKVASLAIGTPHGRESALLADAIEDLSGTLSPL